VAALGVDLEPFERARREHVEVEHQPAERHPVEHDVGIAVRAAEADGRRAAARGARHPRARHHAEQVGGAHRVAALDVGARDEVAEAILAPLVEAGERAGVRGARRAHHHALEQRRRRRQLQQQRRPVRRRNVDRGRQDREAHPAHLHGGWAAADGAEAERAVVVGDGGVRRAAGPGDDHARARHRHVDRRPDHAGDHRDHAVARGLGLGGEREAEQRAGGGVRRDRAAGGAG
jgi:hypothetical protein